MVHRAAGGNIRIGFGVGQCVGRILVGTIEDFSFRVHGCNIALRMGGREGLGATASAADFDCLRPDPKRFLIVQAQPHKRFARIRLHRLEPSLELGIRTAQRGLRVDAQLA